MGLQEILTEVRSQAESENTGLIQQTKKQTETMLLEKQKDLAALYTRKREELDIELKRLTAKLMAKVELDNIRELQKMELSIIDNALAESYDELIKVLRADTGRYQKFLIALVQGAVQIIQEKNIGLSFAKEDESYFSSIQKAVQADLKLLPSVKISGGVICTSGETYIDNSIENIFSKMKPEFIKAIADAVAVA